MSYYPLLNYNWKDTGGNILPIANSYFAYGTLVNNITTLSSKQWGSLKVNTLSMSPAPSNIVDISGNALRFNITGIYEITTNLQFTVLTGAQTLGFSYSTALNDGSDDAINNTTNNIKGGIKCLDGSNNTLSVTPYFINGSSSGGGTNSLVDTTNCGGNVLILNTWPFFILPNPSLSSTNNINTVNSIYYIPANTDIYFNIANLVSATSGLRATGSFTVHLLNAMMPSVTTSSNLNISNLNFINTGTGRGYYYYTFFPTNTAANGTATIQILTSATINYLLVGGGGGGGGGSYGEYSSITGGGGGGGGQIKTGSTPGGQMTITVGNAGSDGVTGGNGGPGGNTVLNTIIATGGGGGSNTSLGGIGGGAAGGQGYQFQPDQDQGSTSGGPGQSINISQIGLTYNVGGGGGGGGINIGDDYNGGAGGNNNNGGAANGSTDYNGTNGIGYGTGGGGGGGYSVGGSGGSGVSGFAVLYWEA
jgi:hypothetical protein